MAPLCPPPQDNLNLLLTEEEMYSLMETLRSCKIIPGAYPPGAPGSQMAAGPPSILDTTQPICPLRELPDPG